MTDPHHDLIERANRWLKNRGHQQPCCDPDCSMIRDLRDALAERAAMPTRAREEIGKMLFLWQHGADKEDRWSTPGWAERTEKCLAKADTILELFEKKETKPERAAMPTRADEEKKS